MRLIILSFYKLGYHNPLIGTEGKQPAVGQFKGNHPDDARKIMVLANQKALKSGYFTYVLNEPCICCFNAPNLRLSYTYIMN